MAVARILLIDDDEDFRTSVRSLLEAYGYEVFEAATGEEGLSKLVKNRPGAILLDVMLECCSEGYGINAAIKYQDAYAEFRDVPILMVSSIQETPDERFPLAGEVEMIRPDWYLTKPLDFAKLLSLLERCGCSPQHVSTSG